ncbi:PREDICTED: translation initiation factor IF-2-like [Chinchilla lanigera]|uniref:translation initiation factor IF-2-like n=1 Tax=Chinchilla lanigera TaxID=34839 RepID=UPI000697CAD8|nr:PREDICTED: translation initiation factor IF-2-like [Chinchilla lanigera]
MGLPLSHLSSSVPSLFPLTSGREAPTSIPRRSFHASHKHALQSREGATPTGNRRTQISKQGQNFLTVRSPERGRRRRAGVGQAKVLPRNEGPAARSPQRSHLPDLRPGQVPQGQGRPRARFPTRGVGRVAAQRACGWRPGPAALLPHPEPHSPVSSRTRKASEDALLQRCPRGRAELQARALRPGGEGEKALGAAPEPPRPGLAARLPYLLQRGWRRRLLGPAALSWFRATGRGPRGGAQAGAALGVGRGRAGEGGAPTPPAGNREHGDWIPVRVLPVRSVMRYQPLASSAQLSPAGN